jgi:hydroxymethylpyrimidine pyrophosphatase-like HAD family hydrolase
METGLDRLRAHYDAVLLDLDGTLLDGTSRLTARTVEAVRRLVSHDFDVLICTGRSLAGTRPVHAELGLQTPCVAYNGAWIGHPDQTPWREAPIPDPLIPEISRTEAHASFSFRHRGEHKYALVVPDPLHERVSRWYHNVVLVERPSELPVTGLMRVSCFYAGGDLHERAWQAMSAEARGSLHRETFDLNIFSDFRDTNLVLQEVQARGEGKAEAYAWLEAERGIPAERVIAVGDQANDRTMLERAGLAIAMGNAIEAVRRLAHLTIGHHAQEGFAAWVEAGAPREAARLRGTGHAGDGEDAA